MAKTFEESWEHSIYAGTALANIRKPIFKDGWHARDAEIEAKDKQIERVKKLLDGFDPFQAGRDGDDCIWCCRTCNHAKIDTWQQSQHPDFHDMDCEFILTLAALEGK
jgi:hypothetical protein